METRVLLLVLDLYDLLFLPINTETCYSPGELNINHSLETNLLMYKCTLTINLLFFPIFILRRYSYISGTYTVT